METVNIIIIQTLAGAGASIFSLIAFAIFVYRKSSATTNVVVFITCQALTALTILLRVDAIISKRLTIQHILLFSIVFLIFYSIIYNLLRLSKKDKVSSSVAALDKTHVDFAGWLLPPQKENGKVIDTLRMEEQKDKNTESQIVVNPDFEKASHFFPHLLTLLNELSPFGTEIQNRFIEEMLETKKFSTPQPIIDRIIDVYAESRFGSDKSLQKFGVSLIYKRSHEAAIELESYIRVVGAAVASDEIIRHVENKLKYSSVSEKIVRLYSVENGGKTYFVAILKDRSCIGEIEGIYRKSPDLTRFRQAAQDPDAIYSLVHSREAILDFVGKVPSDLWN